MAHIQEPEGIVLVCIRKWSGHDIRSYSLALKLNDAGVRDWETETSGLTQTTTDRSDRQQF